ncbi:MAG: tetratricopeptide repeat protein [Lewinellaceae bacterium]|nr:tetratricopeptide repeat protein [Lewinellaceae bacterium]
MFRFCLFACLFAFLSNAPVAAQAPVLDSLVAACNAYAKADTTKVRMLTNLAGEYQKSDPHKGIVAAGEAITLAQQLNQPLYLAEALNKKGSNLSITGAYTDAVACFEQALRLFEKQGVQKRAANMLNNIGVMYNYAGDYVNALKFFDKAHAAQAALGDNAGAAITLSNMGIISMLSSDYPKALNYFDRAIPTFLK